MASAAADLRALAKRVATLPERVVRAGAEEMNRAIIAELRADTGGDQVLSGAGGRRRRRTKLATTTRISGGRSLATAVIAASPARRGRAQWSWLEDGTATRVVGELRRKRSGPGGKHLQIGGNWITGPVDAGRSPAKHTWTNGVRRGTPAAERAMTRVIDQALR